MFISMYSDIVFKRKGMEVERVIFESHYPEVEVASCVFYISSIILNHEDRYRDKLSVGGNVYCQKG